jgi:hypothetical protein
MLEMHTFVCLDRGQRPASKQSLGPSLISAPLFLMDPLEEPFDIIIIETGLTQSILAASVAASGCYVVSLADRTAVHYRKQAIVCCI